MGSGALLGPCVELVNSIALNCGSGLGALTWSRLGVRGCTVSVAVKNSVIQRHAWLLALISANRNLVRQMIQWGWILKKLNLFRRTSFPFNLWHGDEPASHRVHLFSLAQIADQSVPHVHLWILAQRKNVSLTTWRYTLSSESAGSRPPTVSGAAQALMVAGLVCLASSLGFGQAPPAATTQAPAVRRILLTSARLQRPAGSRCFYNAPKRAKLFTLCASQRGTMLQL
jgi:hypothetical protein